jgi:hypothetical protein
MAMDGHSEYVIVTVFHGNNVYVHCLSVLCESHSYVLTTRGL